MPPASSDERYERRHAFQEQPKRRDLTRNCIKSTDAQRPVRAAMISIGIQIGIQNLARSIQSPDINTFIERFVAEAVGFEPTVGFPLRSVSNRVLSASQPRFRQVLFICAPPRGQGGKGGRRKVWLRPTSGSVRRLRCLACAMTSPRRPRPDRLLSSMRRPTRFVGTRMVPEPGQGSPWWSCRASIRCPWRISS